MKRIVTLALPALAALSLLSGCGGDKPAPKAAAATDGPSTPKSPGVYDTSTLQSGGLDIGEGVGATGSGAGSGGGDGGGPSAKATATGSKSSPFASGAAEVVRTAVPVADYHNLFTQAVAAKYRPVWLDGYDVGAAAFFNVVFRKDNGATPWFEYTEMSAGGYQTRFDTLKGQGFQLTFVESYVNGGQARYAAIWEQSSGVVLSAFHGFSASAYQSMLDKQTKAGYLPAQVSAISVGGGLSYSGLLIKRSLGASWVLKTDLTDTAYQQLFDEQTKAGLGLAYLNAYVVSGAPRFVALFAASSKAVLQAKHGMTAASFTSQTTTLEKQGYSTRAVSGYASNGKPAFIAYWSK